MSKSIRYYYFTSIATVLVASVVVMGIIQMYLATSYFKQEKETLLERAVVTVASAAQTGEIRLEDDSGRNIYFMAQIAGASVYVANEEGIIVYCSNPEDNLIGAQLPLKILENIDKNGRYNELGRLNGLFVRNFYTVAIQLTNTAAGNEGYVIASSDASGLKTYLSEMMSSFVLSAALVLLLASILALIMTNRTAIPLRRVSEAARQFGEGNYSARVPVEGDDELAQLAVTFNEMAKAFEATDRSRRSFMGNIAHELRTPMTTIKGFIDGVLDGTIPEDKRDKYLKIVSSEVGRLARLTKNMLDISRLESGEYTANATTFDIWGPLATVFIGGEQRLEEKHIELEGMQVYPPVNVTADADFVYQVLYNLSDNAIKFTEENGTIHVSVSTVKNMVTIGISNTGGGIPKESLAFIFDRFYKTDKSRGLNAAGSGLGLHICKVLVGLMGGRIWAESDESTTTTFWFTLPTAPAKRGSGRPKARQNTQEIK